MSNLIGRKVEISKEHNSAWYGVFNIIDEYSLDDGLYVIIDHPTLRRGAFKVADCSIIPLSKLEKAMK